MKRALHFAWLASLLLAVLLPALDADLRGRPGVLAARLSTLVWISMLLPAVDPAE